MRDPRVTGGAPDAACVADDELARLFDQLTSYPRIVLAVSGGADSMALMFLAARWLELSGGKRPAVEVATVDHGLRPQSAEEARWVAAEARALGFEHATLVWEGEKPEAGYEEAAREWRYRLLGEYSAAARVRPVAIVTAHTEDDQAETLLMRLARGSGVDGLSAMTSRRPLPGYDGVDIVRPLLSLARHRLVATLVRAGRTWREDPANASLDFERVRLRASRPELDALGLTSDKLALSARRLYRARVALDRASAHLADDTVVLNGGIFASIDRSRFALADAELRIRSLSRTLHAFGGESKSPRLSQVEALADALAGPDKVAVTLGGSIVTAGARTIRVMREASKESLPVIVLEPGATAVWDGRFRVSVASARKLEASGVKAPVVVRALGAGAYATLRGRTKSGPGLPARAVAGLPSFWAGGALIAVPPLVAAGVALEGIGHEACKAEFVGWSLAKSGRS